MAERGFSPGRPRLKCGTFCNNWPPQGGSLCGVKELGQTAGFFTFWCHFGLHVFEPQAPGCFCFLEVLGVFRVSQACLQYRVGHHEASASRNLIHINQRSSWTGSEVEEIGGRPKNRQAYYDGAGASGRARTASREGPGAQTQARWLWAWVGSVEAGLPKKSFLKRLSTHLVLARQSKFSQG